MAVPTGGEATGHSAANKTSSSACSLYPLPLPTCSSSSSRQMLAFHPAQVAGPRGKGWAGQRKGVPGQRQLWRRRLRVVAARTLTPLEVLVVL